MRKLPVEVVASNSSIRGASPRSTTSASPFAAEDGVVMRSLYSSSSSPGVAASSSPLLRRPEMVEVMAPCDMQAGFCFMASHDGLAFPVQVPPGGVKGGQTFWAPYAASLTDLKHGGGGSGGTSIIMTEGTSLLSSYHGSSSPSWGLLDRSLSSFSGKGMGSHGRLPPSSSSLASSAPVLRKWKTSLFHCCRHGPFHPVVWNATCCPLVLAAQILTRLELNPMGDPSPNYRRTFPIVLAIVILYWALSAWLATPSSLYLSNSGGYHADAGVDDGDPWYTAAGSEDGDDAALASWGGLSWWRTALYNFVCVAFGLYTWYILTRIRAAVRLRHGIPSRTAPVLPGCVEDACVSFWCGCCSAAQLAHQTADFDNDSGAEEAACCTSTGLAGTGSQKNAGRRGGFWKNMSWGGNIGEGGDAVTPFIV